MDSQKQTSFIARFFLGKVTALRYGRFIYQLLTHLQTKPHYLFLSVALDFISASLSYLRIFLLLPLLRSLILADHDHLNKTWVMIHLRKVLPWVADTFTPLSIALSGFLFLSLLHITCTFVSGKLMDVQSRMLITQLRSLIYRKFLATTREFQEKQSLSKFNSLISRNAESVASQLQALHQVISENLKLLSFGLAMFTISWRMTLITLVITGFFNLGATIIHRRLRRVADREKALRDGLDQDLFQSVSFLPLYQSLGTESREYQHFVHQSELQAKVAHQQKRLILTQDALEELAILGSLLAMAIYMVIYSPARSASEASIYLLFFFLVRNVGLGINAIDRFRNALAMTFASFRETLPWLDNADDLIRKFQNVSASQPIQPHLPGSFHETPEPRASFPTAVDITFARTHFGYAGKPLLFRELDITLNGGKWTGIMGPSGCGKSTLIQSIYFQYPLRDGQITIGGTDLKQIAMPDVRRHIAYVPHESLFFAKSIRENLTYGIDAVTDDRHILQLCEKFELSGFLSQLSAGLDTRLGEQGTRISAGEKQRLALVRAVLRDCPVYFFDEATSALDFATEAKVISQLRDILAGKTVVIISHRASALADCHDFIRFDGVGKPKKFSLIDEMGFLTADGDRILREYSVLPRATRRSA